MHGVIVRDGSEVAGKRERESFGRTQATGGLRTCLDVSVLVPFVFSTIHERADLSQTVFTSVACNVYPADTM